MASFLLAHGPVAHSSYALTSCPWLKGHMPQMEACEAWRPQMEGTFSWMHRHDEFVNKGC